MILIICSFHIVEVAMFINKVGLNDVYLIEADSIKWRIIED